MKGELIRLAQEIKCLYNMGEISRAEAKERIKPYEEYYNNKSIEIAKKYNRRAARFNFNAFMR